ncbi:hypothetical protein QAD02_020667, partial [Eretmocerus hayati]
MESIYSTFALMIVELASEETVLEFMRLIISIQDLAVKNTQISNDAKSRLHVIVISLFILVARVCDTPNLVEYGIKIIETRLKESPSLLPGEHWVHDMPPLPQIRSQILIDQNIVMEYLRGLGLETSKLQHNSLYMTSSTQNRYSWTDTAGRHSMSDINGGFPELDSAGSSPGIQK